MLLQFDGTCANPNDSSLGDWCVVDPNTCDVAPWDSTWDICHVSTRNGCKCRNAWSYAGSALFHGTCGNPDADTGGAWCFVEPGSCTGFAGSSWDYCGPGEPRQTTDGQQCLLPFTYNEIEHYDCTLRDDVAEWCCVDEECNWGYCVVDDRTPEPSSDPDENGSSYCG